ncbi:Dolichyl-diphosphooligosaccharide--protein glycosyltransferase subunit WBP1 [Candida viswanathii]|uniref:Dolichyl-diphosphooligosaccharide--protein glycosyltransferase subunit WBP1 n=1 Tax=Candida viswanathii TaxID=5486 RepID=A0A367XSJ4_9ASCO|nr:Dolichyl-diphosphooligosaccharide--protein glycosyltransferase subunit WBP1 [Candida viswanathii]
MFKQFYIFLTCLLITIVSAKHALLNTEHVLVLYDPELVPLNDSAKLTPAVSQFITYLYDKFSVTTSTYNDDDAQEISLFYEDFPKYQHIVFFPSSKKAIKLKEVLNQHNLLKFINEDGNVLVVGGSSGVLPDGIRGFLNEVGIYPAPKNFKYVDHFNAKKGGVVELKLENIVSSRLIKGDELIGAEYDGSAALISNNEHIFPIVRSSATGYTGKAGDVAMDAESTWTFGQQGYLAVGFQALNNARLVWLGSSSLLAVPELYQWCFQRQGKLKLQFVQHVKANEPDRPDPQLYRIKDQAIYTIGVSELVDGEWVPFKVESDEDQLQLSFKMLDPYQRLNLRPLGEVSSNEADASQLDTYAYYANFTVPDHHGMFTFELDYKRVGLSYLSDKRVVTVRHLANDEFKRSWDITNSWLYVASTAFVIVAWFIFVVSYIYVGKPNTAKKNE